ncbi:MAG: hypothetical protein ACR2H1_00465, partial [Limisphaerales bacterium]
KLLEETVAAVPEADGHFTFTTRLAQPMDVVAVWISCDGDDTKYSFAVVLNKVELVTKDSTEKRGNSK